MTIFRAPDDKNYDVLLAENRFISDLQIAIESALTEAGHSQADFARALGISEARVSQLLGGNGCNLQARTIARIAHFLGKRALVEFIDAFNAGNACDKHASSNFDFQAWTKNLPAADEYERQDGKRSQSEKRRILAVHNDNELLMAQVG